MSTEQEIVEELKRRFPRPVFGEWVVRQTLCSWWTADIYINGLPANDGRITLSPRRTLDHLLAAIRALPLPAEADALTALRELAVVAKKQNWCISKLLLGHTSASMWSRLRAADSDYAAFLACHRELLEGSEGKENEGT